MTLVVSAANPWPQIEAKIIEKLSAAEKRTTSGACRSFDHYRYLCGGMNALRDVLDIADEIINPKPAPDETATSAFENDGDI